MNKFCLQASRLVLLAIALLLCTFGNAAEKPNIIFILTDDMGYADVGCYGGKFAPTPNIDHLAKEGTRFTGYYSASPICSPSRTALITGMFPARWNITSFLQTRAGNRAVGQADFLDPKAPSIARTLKTAGYATAHIGKWHLGGGRDVTNAPPFSAYGYDEHASTYESPQPDPEITATNWIWSADDKVKRWDRSAYFVDKTLDFLRRHKGQPCFVNFWADDVHTPWIPEGAAPNRERNAHESEAEFTAVLHEYDRQVGRLMAGLKELGIDDNTLVIFTSDNGPGPDFPGNPRSLGMRGRKGSLYDGGTHMPFIARWPAKIPANRVDEKSLFNAVDMFPTFCKLAGARAPEGVAFDGQDMSKIFDGKSVVRKDPMFWEYGRNNTAFGYPPRNKDKSPNVAIRDGKWKLLVNADGTGAELYNMEADCNETKDIAGENPRITKRMTTAAMKWRESLPDLK